MATTTHRQNQQYSQNQRNNQDSDRQQPDHQNQNGQNDENQNHHGPVQNHQGPVQNHQGPVESFRLNNVSISIFENESERDGQKSRYHRAKIDKRYRDQKSGEWKSTTSFSLDELLRLQHLIGNAVDFMAAKPGE